MAESIRRWRPDEPGDRRTDLSKVNPMYGY
jgi:hypothetical protein